MEVSFYIFIAVRKYHGHEFVTLSSTEAQYFGPSIRGASMARSAMRDRVRSTSLCQIVISLREDSQVDFVARNVPWMFGGEGICPGRFFCHK